MHDSEKLARIRRVLIQIDQVLEREDESNWRRGIRAMLGEVDAAGTSISETESLANVTSMYRTMRGGAGSFSDFYIWRDDFDERVKVNREFEKLTDELWNALDL